MTRPKAATAELPADPLWTTDQAAIFLQMSRAQLYSMRARGDGPPGFRVGAQLRYRSSELEQWLQERRDDPADRRHAAV